MAVSLASLVDQVESDVPARNGVPSSDQYEQAVKAAVNDFSSRAPMKKYAELSIISGTASYSLPAGFRSIVTLESPFSPDGVLNTPAGLIPVSLGYKERYSIAGGNITFIPTPEYTLTRSLWYLAGYVLDEDEIYQDMTEVEADIVVLKAKSLVTRIQTNKARSEGWRYRIGDEEVDKSKIGSGLDSESEALKSDYLEAVEAYIGPVGARSG